MATESRLLVLMFTDLVGSSSLKISLGDRDYVAQIAKPHNDIFRSLLRQFPTAEENNYTGDGFIAIFTRVSDAVDFALLFHHQLRTYKWAGPVPQTRVGIHVGQSLLIDDPGNSKVIVASHAADTCARLMSLGVGGQTLLTRHACDDARQFVRRHPALPDGSEPPEVDFKYHGLVRFKGNETEALEVFEVGALTISPFVRPPDSEKAHWYQNLEEERLKKWLPAINLETPGRPGWIIERKLGEGGFGEVWLIKNAKTGTQRVLKFCFDLEKLRSFKRELALFRLMHETLGDRTDIAKLIDIRLDKPPYFLESEYIQGGNLPDWAARHGGLAAIPLEQRLKIMAQVVRAVAAAHTVGVIHKDIKPANILMRDLQGGGVQPILADFGIGAITDKAVINPDMTMSGFAEATQIGSRNSTAGTQMFIAPEVLMEKPATTASDVYALGIMLYQVVVGDFKRPMAVGWERDIPDKLICEDIRASVEGDPAARLSSAAELALRLETLESRRASFNSRQLSDNNRIQRRMGFELMAAVLIPLLVMVCIFLFQVRGEMLAHAGVKLHVVAEITAARLDQILIDSMRDSQQIAAANRDLAALCINPDTASQQVREDVQNTLASVVSTHPEYQLALVLDPQGKVIATTDPAATGGEMSQSPNFQRGLKGETSASDMVMGKFVKTPCVYIYTPIQTHQEGKPPKVHGVLVVKLEAKVLWNLTNEVKLSSRGYAMIVDENGIVISHPDANLLFRSLAPLSAERLAALNPSAKYGTSTVESLNMPGLASVSSVTEELILFSASDGESGNTAWVAGQAWMKQKPWRICVLETQAQFIAPATAMIRTQSILACLVAVIACAVVIWRARRATHG
jgi:serine/threonine protein kinase/class 3 adenylate cyclase